MAYIRNAVHLGGASQSGAGYVDAGGRYVPVANAYLLPSQTFALGTTRGSMFDTAGVNVLRAELRATAKGGTSPTLDVAIYTSKFGKNWRLVGSAFTQISDTLAFSAVSSSGTTPPAITLSGTPVRALSNVKIKVATTGSRGTFTIQTSLDNGASYNAEQLSAATVTLYDEDGDDTGVVLNIANASAAADNVWTFNTTAWQYQVFTGFDRYLRAVANVGGSNTPTYTASLIGEYVDAT